MNYIKQNGYTIIQRNDAIEVNGKSYNMPSWVKKKNKNTLTVKNGKIIINGARFNPETGEFKRKWF